MLLKILIKTFEISVKIEMTEKKTLPLFPVYRCFNDQASFDFKMCLSDGSLNLKNYLERQIVSYNL